MNLIVSAPSGSGKTTILKKLFEKYPDIFGFSISATTRKPRQGEVNAKDYYFISPEEFGNKLADNEFLEYEQVYENLYYGTLKSEIERINALNKYPVFDVDVKGGMNIKKHLGDRAFSIFIMPPSLEILKQRLLNRKTESEDSLKKRLDRAEMEMAYSECFDLVVINDDLDKAVEEFIKAVEDHIL
ncbi:MAG: guanylate kinase [Bacteroidales bacterium]|nr:guanylate kinase [Bacteroidales bacterium]